MGRRGARIAAASVVEEAAGAAEEAAGGLCDTREEAVVTVGRGIAERLGACAGLADVGRLVLACNLDRGGGRCRRRCRSVGVGGRRGRFVGIGDP